MHASRALVGSLIVNGVIVALLFAIAPRRFERPAVPPILVDVAVAPIPPPPPVAPMIVPVAMPTPMPPGRPRHAPRGVAPPPSSSPAVDDALAGNGGSDAAGSGVGGDGNGNGDGSGHGTGVARVPTMPVPIGAHDAQLPYTRDALLSHTEGVVLVRLSVGADGKVAKTTLARGLGHGLDAIAMSLAAKLEFEPARDALGQPITAQITWRFHFTPPPDAASL
jgi:TonB family protein